jgi:hypothetical protein
MALFSEKLEAGLFLLTNTFIIIISALFGGAIMTSLFNWVGAQGITEPTVKGMATWAQPIPMYFFGFLILLEFVLIVRLYFVAVSSIDYNMEDNF